MRIGTVNFLAWWHTFSAKSDRMGEKVHPKPSGTQSPHDCQTQRSNTRKKITGDMSRDKSRDLVHAQHWLQMFHGQRSVVLLWQKASILVICCLVRPDSARSPCSLWKRSRRAIEIVD